MSKRVPPILIRPPRGAARSAAPTEPPRREPTELEPSEDTTTARQVAKIDIDTSPAEAKLRALREMVIAARDELAELQQAAGALYILRRTNCPDCLGCGNTLCPHCAEPVDYLCGHCHGLGRLNAPCPHCDNGTVYYDDEGRRVRVAVVANECRRFTKPRRAS